MRGPAPTRFDRRMLFDTLGVKRGYVSTLGTAVVGMNCGSVILGDGCRFLFSVLCVSHSWYRT